MEVAPRDKRDNAQMGLFTTRSQQVDVKKRQCAAKNNASSSRSRFDAVQTMKAEKDKAEADAGKFKSTAEKVEKEHRELSKRTQKLEEDNKNLVKDKAKYHAESAEKTNIIRKMRKVIAELEEKVKKSEETVKENATLKIELQTSETAKKNLQRAVSSAESSKSAFERVAQEARTQNKKIKKEMKEKEEVIVNREKRIHSLSNSNETLKRENKRLRAEDGSHVSGYRSGSPTTVANDNDNEDLESLFGEASIYGDDNAGSARSGSVTPSGDSSTHRNRGRRNPQAVRGLPRPVYSKPSFPDPKYVEDRACKPGHHWVRGHQAKNPERKWS